MRIRNQLSLLLLATLCTGCSAKYIQVYDGPKLGTNQVAILKCAPLLNISAVDGNTEYRTYSGGGLWYRNCDIHFLPGEHTVTFNYFLSYSTGYSYHTSSSTPVTLGFNAKAGRIYKIFYTTKKRKFLPWIADITDLKEKPKEKDKSSAFRPGRR